MASAAASLLAVPAVAGEDVESQLAEMQELVKGLQQKVDAQEEQIEHQGQLLEDAQRVVRADEQGSKSGLSAWIDSIEVDGAVIASYNFNVNTPTDNGFDGTSLTGSGQGQNTGDSGFFMPEHADANSFAVDQVWFGIGKPATEESRGGFRFDLFYGATACSYGDNGGQDSEDGSNTNCYAFDNAYVEYLAPIADINVKMGLFVTPVGAEVAKQWQNFNITRGNVYWMMQPFSHVGVLGTVPLGDMAEFGAGIANSAAGGDLSPDDNEEKSYIATVKLGDDRANIRTSFLYGSEPTIVTAPINNGSGNGDINVTGDQVGLVDVTAWFNPADNVSLWANYDYLFIEDTGYYANGIAVAGRVELIEKLGFSVRGEYVQEHAAQNKGSLVIGNNDTTDIWSVTGTTDYALTEHLKVKSEFRWDRANGASVSPGASLNQFAENNPDDFSSLDQMIWLIAAEYVF
jgi:hypothetical protein